MIMADSFCQNKKARASEFATTANDTPLVVQLAANNVDDFIDATKLLYPYADGIDLNCGCPQRWAMKDGYGCALLSKPEIIYNLVKGVRNALPSSFSVSVKIRLLKELRKTIETCKQLEQCGVNFLTVHGRIPSQKSSGTVNTSALKEVWESVKIPIIANGGVKSLEDATKMYDATNCDGVMAASGLLTNPALFGGAHKTPVSCVRHWMKLKDRDPEKITFQCYHHHLVFMLEKILSKNEKQIFNELSSFEKVDDFLDNYFEINESLYDTDVDFKYDMAEFIPCQFAEEITLKHASKCRGCSKSVHYCICRKYDSNATDGSFFSSYVKDNDALDYLCNMFDEQSI